MVKQPKKYLMKSPEKLREARCRLMQVMSFLNSEHRYKIPEGAWLKSSIEYSLNKVDSFLKEETDDYL